MPSGEKLARLIKTTSEQLGELRRHLIATEQGASLAMLCPVETSLEECLKMLAALNSPSRDVEPNDK